MSTLNEFGRQRARVRQNLADAKRYFDEGRMTSETYKTVTRDGRRALTEIDQAENASRSNRQRE
jgi:hypothetical protein